jgi:hypothetical protein
MKNAMKFVVKAFFGGCIGCLGASIMTVVVVGLIVLILATTVGPGLVRSASGLFQSIPSMITSSIGGMIVGEQNNPTQAALNLPSVACPQGNLPEIKIFMTAGKDPGAEHLTQVASASSNKVTFWVQSPQQVTVKFVLVLTTPDGRGQVWGPVENPLFTSDPSGMPFSVGGFTTPVAAGQYKVTVFLCQTVSAGELTFQVTP